MSLTPPRYTAKQFDSSAEWMENELRLSFERDMTTEELTAWSAMFRQAAGQARVLDRLRETLEKAIVDLPIEGTSTYRMGIREGWLNAREWLSRLLREEGVTP